MGYVCIRRQTMIRRKDQRRAWDLKLTGLLVALALLVLFLAGSLFCCEESCAAAGTAQNAGSCVDWKGILDDAGNSPQKDLDAHLLLAVSYANLGMIPEATCEFRVIEAAGYDEFGKRVIDDNNDRLKKSPDDIICLNLLAFAYYSFGNYSKSVDCFQSLRKLDPMNVWIHHYYAYSLWKADRMDEAIGVLKDALAIDPSNDYTHLLLGLAYKENGWYLLSLLELARARKAIGELSGLAD